VPTNQTRLVRVFSCPVGATVNDTGRFPQIDNRRSLFRRLFQIETPCNT
jgi:hypothetical protein